MSIVHILAQARRLLLVLIVTPTLALAAPTYTVVGSIGISQLGPPAVSDLGTGLASWVTSLDLTNNDAAATGHLYLIVTAQWVQGDPSNATAMQWSNAAGQFEKDGLVARADNAALFINLSDTDIGPLNPIFGINASDSLAAFDLGFIAFGSTLSTQTNFLVSSSVGAMWFSGVFVQAAAELPEPAGLALVSMALVAAVMARRRRH